MVAFFCLDIVRVNRRDGPLAAKQQSKHPGKANRYRVKE